VAYDEQLAHRIRELIPDSEEVTERRMFGGLAFMIGGRMAIAAGSGGGILLPVDPERADQLVQEPQVSHMVMRGREMAGWLTIEPEAVAGREELARWVQLALRAKPVRPAPPG
jgi:TfoX/Sxy family transcriptional regulator of competence genes